MNDRYLTRKRARLRAAQGIPSYLPAAPVAEHIRALRANGWVVAQISEWAQISCGTVHRILAGEHRRVQHSTGARITALDPARVPPRNR